VEEARSLLHPAATGVVFVRIACQERDAGPSPEPWVRAACYSAEQMQVRVNKATLMPRFFFHVSLEGSILRDDEGQDLPDADAAWESARGAALDLMKADLGRPVNWFDCYFQVMNGSEEVVLEFPFVEAVEIKKLPN
jgi:hypothetical protein